MKPSEYFIVVGDINSPLKHFCRSLNIAVLLTVTCTSAKHTQGNGTLCSNKDYAIAPRYYIYLHGMAFLPIAKTQNESNKTSSTTWKVPSMRNVVETTTNHKLPAFASTIFRHSFQLFLTIVGLYQDPVYFERDRLVTHSSNPFTAFSFQCTLQKYLESPAISEKWELFCNG